MLQHYSTNHTLIFQQHGHQHDRLTGPMNQISPCQLCGQTFRQQHQCILLRQLAMLMTSESMTNNAAQLATIPAPPTATWPCPHCPKVYTTRHGLKLHLTKYHRAMEVNTLAPPPEHPEAHLHNMVTQAVVTDDCASLLSNPDISRVLSLRCFCCQIDFTKKNLLTRHFRTHHSLDREQDLTEANALDIQLRPHNACFCVPSQLQRHVCLPFRQYAMLRRRHIHAEREVESRQALASTSVPPFAVDDADISDVEEPTSTPLVFMMDYLPLRSNVNVIEHVALMLRFGQLDQLALSKQLRTELSLACQLCLETFSNPESLEDHLQEHHFTDLAASSRHHDLLRWIFKDNGCLCNPGVAWDTLGHRCICLVQVAIIHARTEQDLLVPWPYKAADIVAVLSTVMPNHLLLPIAFAMISRQFSRLAVDEFLRNLMQQTCLVCRANITDVGFEAHFHSCHRRVIGRGPELIREQLRGRPWPMVSDDDFAMHVATLIALPVWYRTHEVTSTWPTRRLRGLSYTGLVSTDGPK